MFQVARLDAGRIGAHAHQQIGVGELACVGAKARRERIPFVVLREGVGRIANLPHFCQGVDRPLAVERRRVIAVLPNRLKATLEPWLDELSEEERRAIKVVSMDMWEAYRQAVRNKLPHAEIVADCFHVVKQLDHQLDLLHRNLRKNGAEALQELLLAECGGA